MTSDATIQTAGDQTVTAEGEKELKAKLEIDAPIAKIDSVTIAGLIVALSLIFIALFLGGTPQAFFNVPALLIVLGGTLAVSAISCTGDEISKLGITLRSTLRQVVQEPQKMAMQLMQMAVIAKNH